VITVQEGGAGEVEAALRRVRNVWDSKRGDQLLYRVMDGIVDAYVPTLDRFAASIDEIEDLVLENPTPEALSRIFSTKRCLI
jgi:Mg2+ and Co2+ transporter CorA